MGAAYVVIGILVQLAIVIPWLRSKHIDFELGGDVGHAMVGPHRRVRLFAIMGIGVGSLLRNRSRSHQPPLKQGQPTVALVFATG